MGVSVDEPRKDELAFSVDRLRGGEPGFHFVAWANRDDGVTRNSDRSIVIDGAFAVHGDDRASGDDQVGVVSCGLA